MRTRNRIRSVIAMTLAAVLLLPGMALADTVTNDFTSSTAGVLSVQAGSSAGVTYRVQNNNSTPTTPPIPRTPATRRTALH